jgi:hypothetical protein
VYQRGAITDLGIQVHFTNKSKLSKWCAATPLEKARILSSVGSLLTSLFGAEAVLLQQQTLS